MISESLQQRLTVALGSVPLHLTPVTGGCISEAFACHLEDGRKLFVKSQAEPTPGMFASEVAGLAWLAEAQAIRIPSLVAVGPDFLALEFIESAPPAKDYDESFGRSLALLHQYGAPCFGLEEDGFLATLAQDNRPASNWPSFYYERRLLPLARRAIDHGLAPLSWVQLFEELGSQLSELVGDAEAPARLHGDLWSGNVVTDSEGQPTLIDPAVYGGHREVDLAMLRLFGSPSATFIDAYQSVTPLQPGHEERVPLYQLYPLLAHVNLFGGNYVQSCRDALCHYL